MLALAIANCNHSFPVFVIELNQKPQDRFKEPAKYFKEGVLLAADQFMTEIPKAVEVIYKLFSWTWWITHHERYMEIKGIVEAIDEPSLTLSKAILINSLYELQAWCTSIVAQQADGKIVHSRNLDFDFANYMRNITFRANFTRDGEYVYDAVMFAGTIGVYTGMKANAFSLSENQRWPNSNIFGLVKNLW